MERAFASRYAKLYFFTVLALLITMYVGSRSFLHIDLGLYGYMVGSVVFIGGFLYRFLAWAERPPTKVLIKKGSKLLFRGSTPKTVTHHIVTQQFICNRSFYRWTQHLLIAWGCLISAFVTFPLVFGWMYFTMDVNEQYTVVFFGINILKMSADGTLAFLFYNALNITAFMVIGGCSMAIYRRLKNTMAFAEQVAVYDFLPLYLLLLVSVTGLLLTFSNIAMHGFGHPVLSLIHQWCVISTLLFLPFSKLAHIPFRSVSVFARNYREHYGKQAMHRCRICNDAYVSTEQAQDVIDVLKQNELEFAKPEGYHLAELCLSCRRKYRIARFSGVPTHMIPHKEANQNA